MSKNMPQTRKETEFALAALMEIPSQYKATIELGILGRMTSKSPERVPLPPPVGSYSTPSMGSKSFGSASYPQQNTSTYPEYTPPQSTASPTASSSWDDQQVCPICLTNPKNMAFRCGHQTCYECGPNLQSCPICRSKIVTRKMLYFCLYMKKSRQEFKIYWELELCLKSLCIQVDQAEWDKRDIYILDSFVLYVDSHCDIII